jgi:hypothetical protein
MMFNVLDKRSGMVDQLATNKENVPPPFAQNKGQKSTRLNGSPITSTKAKWTIDA